MINVGWREWAALPDLGLPAIKVKVDTGARTSALHAFDVDAFNRDGKDFVRFCMHPLQNNDLLVINCEAPIIDQRIVSDSGGHKESRYVIETLLVIGGDQWPIEMTLTNRDNMRFRMLLGRRAMQNRIVVFPDDSYVCGKLNISELYADKLDGR